MGLTNKREEQLKKMPKIETQVLKSKDGKYIIHRTSISYIKPTNYYRKIIETTEVQEIDMTEFEDITPA